MTKKFLSLLLVSSLNLMLCTAYADNYFDFQYYNYDNDEREIRVQVNGEFIEFETPPASLDYVTYAQTELLAEYLKTEPSELETTEIDGVVMSPVRASADFKGWNTYWNEWSKSIVIIDTESLRNDFKSATSEYLALLEMLMNIPKNGEYSLESDFSMKFDGKDNGFSVYTKGNVKGGVKLEENKIAGSFVISYEGINKLIWMIVSSMFDMPYTDIDFDFYIDDSGIYVKSALVNMLLLNRYYVSDEFKHNNVMKWYKIGYDEIGIDGLNGIDKIRDFDKVTAIDLFVNSYIFNDMYPENAYVSNWTYENWKEKVDNVANLKINNFVKITEDGAVIEFTAKDLQWALEKVKEDIKQGEYYDEETDGKNLELLEQFIDSISGGLKTEYTFENEYMKEVNSVIDFKMVIPFHFNQRISSAEISGNGTIELKNIGETVITETLPAEYFTNSQIEESNKYLYNNFETPTNES